MPDKRIQDMPLRDQLTETERLLRELIDHVERGFLPKVARLSRMASATGHSATAAERDSLSSVTDTTIRNQSDDVLKSHSFAEYVTTKTDEHFSAIETTLRRIVEGE